MTLNLLHNKGSATAIKIVGALVTVGVLYRHRPKAVHASLRLKTGENNLKTGEHKSQWGRVDVKDSTVRSVTDREKTGEPPVSHRHQHTGDAGGHRSTKDVQSTKKHFLSQLWAANGGGADQMSFSMSPKVKEAVNKPLPVPLRNKTNKIRLDPGQLRLGSIIKPESGFKFSNKSQEKGEHKEHKDESSERRQGAENREPKHTETIEESEYGKRIDDYTTDVGKSANTKIQSCSHGFSTEHLSEDHPGLSAILIGTNRKDCEVQSTNKAEGIGETRDEDMCVEEKSCEQKYHGEKRREEMSHKNKILEQKLQEVKCREEFNSVEKCSKELKDVSYILETGQQISQEEAKHPHVEDMHQPSDIEKAKLSYSEDVQTSNIDKMKPPHIEEVNQPATIDTAKPERVVASVDMGIDHLKTLELQHAPNDVQVDILAREPSLYRVESVYRLIFEKTRLNQQNIEAWYRYKESSRVYIRLASHEHKRTLLQVGALEDEKTGNRLHFSEPGKESLEVYVSYIPVGLPIKLARVIGNHLAPTAVVQEVIPHPGGRLDKMLFMVTGCSMEDIPHYLEYRHKGETLCEMLITIPGRIPACSHCFSTKHLSSDHEDALMQSVPETQSDKLSDFREEHSSVNPPNTRVAVCTPCSSTDNVPQQQVEVMVHINKRTLELKDAGGDMDIFEDEEQSIDEHDEDKRSEHLEQRREDDQDEFDYKSKEDEMITTDESSYDLHTDNTKMARDCSVDNMSWYITEESSDKDNSNTEMDKKERQERKDQQDTCEDEAFSWILSDYKTDNQEISKENEPQDAPCEDDDDFVYFYK